MKKSFFLTIIFCLILVGRVQAEIIDSDDDGLSDETEIALQTDPNQVDSDGDGYADGVEIKNGFNPLEGKGDRNIKRRMEVDLATQTAVLYVNEIKIGEALVSTGMKSLPTPVGSFNIIRKRPVVHYKGPGYDLPNTKWNLEFKKGFYIHGAYWHNNFGVKPVSHGCVNVAYKDMESIYSFLSVGDPVKIFGKAPDKPLQLSKK